MGRSVSYLNHAEYVIYFTAEWIKEGFEWDDFKSNLISNIKGKLKSYSETDSWDDRETHIFLDNNLCEIALAEYCDLFSLSIRVKEHYTCDYPYKQAFGERHAKQIKGALEKALTDAGADLLNRIGTFSTGTGLFTRANKTFENNSDLGIELNAKVS